METNIGESVNKAMIALTETVTFDNFLIIICESLIVLNEIKIYMDNISVKQTTINQKRERTFLF